MTSLEALLCTYEIYIFTDGHYELAGIIVNGLVEGIESVQVVTGAEYDFEEYSSGMLTTLQDPEQPIMYAYLRVE